jgi:two-component system, OmpR family, sensor histidine kinase TctE
VADPPGAVGSPGGGEGGGTRRPVSLRRQLLLWLLAPLVGLFLAGASVTYLIAVKFANGAYDVGLYDSARSISQQVRTAGGLATLALPREALEILASDPYDRVWFMVAQADGRFVAGDRDVPVSPPDCTLPGHVSYFDGGIGRDAVRVACYPAPSDGAPAPYVVYTAETLVKRERLTQQILLAMLVPQFVLICLAGLIVWFGIGRGLIPLARLSDALRRRDHRDLSRVTEEGAPLEVIPLTHAINDLLARLEGALSAQRRFVADAAHQLRTPLAGLLAHTERALASHDESMLRSSLEQLATSARRANRLANQLLSLARAEPDAAAGGVDERIDLAALARDVCGEWVPTALASNADLGYEGDDGPVYVDGDRTLLGELIGNLVDNSLRYGPPGRVVTVRVEESPAPVLRVEDDGIGIPEAERERVLQRFYRVPGSPMGGCGLGLAIVSEIAARHAARMSIGGGHAGRGTAVTIEFPPSMSTGVGAASIKRDSAALL